MPLDKDTLHSKPGWAGGEGTGACQIHSWAQTKFNGYSPGNSLALASKANRSPSERT
jgi:hypothetical protein